MSKNKMWITIVIIFSLIRKLIVFSIICILIIFNLITNSVYYGKYTPHGEGRMPDVELAILMLGRYDTPNIEGLICSNKIINIIRNDNIENSPGISLTGNSYTYIDSKKYTYTFNLKFDLVEASDSEHKSVPLNRVNVNEVKKEIKHVVFPIIDYQPDPIINLQWLFDILSENYFNYKEETK